MTTKTIILPTGLEVYIDYTVTSPEPEVGDFHPYVDAENITVYRPDPSGKLIEVHKDAYWILGESLTGIAQNLTDELE